MSEKNLQYYTIEEICSGEIVEKKSRFIATVYHVETEEEAGSIIDAHKKKFWDARHNCYAYIIGRNSELMRFSDDGEPSGTAGKPILEVLKGRELTYTLVIVTRYFGGVLLGTGGLVRAYTDATAAGIEAGSIKCIRQMKRFRINMDYSLVGKIKYLLAAEEITVLSEDYGEAVSMHIICEDDAIIDKLIDATGGKIESEYVDTDFYSV